MAAYTTHGEFIGAEIHTYRPRPSGIKQGSVVYFRKADVVEIHPFGPNKSVIELKSGSQLALDTPFPALFREITGVELNGGESPHHEGVNVT